MDELLSGVSSREISEWMAYARLEPFGEELMDVRFARLMALIANLVRPQGQKAYDYQDFMPRYGEEQAQEQGWQQQLAVFDMLAAGMAAAAQEPMQEMQEAGI